MVPHFVERVWPDVPVRQWGVDAADRVCLLCAYDPVVCRAVRRILVCAVSGFYLHNARRDGLPRAKTGAVVFQQSFDSALRLNLHSTRCGPTAS